MMKRGFQIIKALFRKKEHSKNGLPP